MKDINTITIAGRLTQDMELKTVGNNFNVGTFSLATHQDINTKGKWEEYTSFFEIKVLGNTAKNLNPYLKKGTRIAVTGTLKQERWEKEDGQQAKKIVIIADDIYFIGAKQNDKETV